MIRGDSDQPLSTDALTELLLSDLAAGRKTDTLYMGRTLDAALRLRDADALATAFTPEA